MKKQIVTRGFFLLAGLVGLACLINISAQKRGGPLATPKSTARPVPAAYHFSGPFTHQNLTVYLIHGASGYTGKTPLTLEEAMAASKVKVRETGEVGELTIENLSNEDVFVQSGDIVKGGQQDRVLAMDLIVPPRSGRVPIASFCVEHGRWSQRGEEAAAIFGSSSQMLNHKDLKIATKSAKSQQQVWAKVAESQGKLGKNVVAISSGVSYGGGSGGGSRSAGGIGPSSQILPASTPAPAAHINVASQVSPTSLQLTLENNVVRETADAYLKTLSPAISGKNDVIGYAFAINGQLNSADVYSSHALFVKLWPRLLRASAVEAIAEYDQSGKTSAAGATALSTDAVRAFLARAEDATVEEKNLTHRVAVEKRESDKYLFFETRDRQKGQAWVHRNYLTK